MGANKIFFTKGMSEERELRQRIEGLLSQYPWIWNDSAKIIAIVWKDDLLNLGQDSKLLSAKGLLSYGWLQKVTDPSKIYEIFKDLQLINNNANSNIMEITTEKVPHKVSILNHLKKHGKITGKDAWRLYGCYRLSSVINRLNKSPEIHIVCKIIEGAKHGEYKLID